MKFGRRYRLTIQTDDKDNALVIEPPFTLQFNVERNNLASLNSCTLVIYNLGENTRSQIFHDRYDTGNVRTLLLEVGYESLSTIFVGQIRTAGSQRQGANIVTLITADSGGYDTTNTYTFETLAAGQSIGDVLRFLTGKFPNINQGVISGYDAKFSRPVVLDGNTFEIIKKYTDLNVFIDNDKLHAIGDNETLVGDLDVLAPDTGLLETPRRDDAYLTVTTLLEPRVIVGQAIALESTVAKLYNGQYKVVGVSHEGIISEAVGGECQSRFTLFMNNNLGKGFTSVGPG